MTVQTVQSVPELRQQTGYRVRHPNGGQADTVGKPISPANSYTNLVTAELGYRRVAPEVSGVARDGELAAVVYGSVPALHFSNIRH